MPQFDAPRLYNLVPRQIDEVIQDLHLMRNRAILYFAVDPHEIAEFCFPVDPENMRQPDIDMIADDQAAFNEIFYSRKPKPVLLPDYIKELDGVMSSFDRKISVAYGRAEILQKLIVDGGLNHILESDSIDPEDIAQDYFNVLLAVARGIFSVGTNRFQEILKTQLLSGRMQTLDPDDQRVIQEIFDSYKATPLVDVIYTEGKKGLKGLDESRVIKERRKRSLRVDAMAIDRALWLNTKFEEAFWENKLSRRHILLYLSSASRTRRIFDLEAVRQSLPELDGKPFPIWRSRRQVFVYVVHRSDNRDKKIGLGETIENLRGVKSVLVELRRLDKTRQFQCEKCILRETSVIPKQAPDDCVYRHFCQRVSLEYDKIQTARKQVHNLGLVNTLDDYEAILKQSKALQSKKEDSFRDYLNLFEEVCRSGIKDIASDKMRQRQRWIVSQSEATHLFKEGMKIVYDGYVFRTKKDRITGVDNILPTKPGLMSKTYNDILRTVIDFYKTPGDQQLALLDKAYDDYLKLDPGPGKRDPEQELISCYLYLAFGRGKAGGESKAYDYAAKLVEKSDSDEYLQMEKEYRYVLLWAARRRGKFAEGDRCATIAIKKWPEDPRFYHGRGLNTYSWIMNDADAPHSISEASGDAAQAVRFYSRDRQANTDVIAANYNNLAYFHAFEATTGASTKSADESLNQARNALNSLKATCDKEKEWDPVHPEYFHTEAFIEYQEYIVSLTRGASREYLLDRLGGARREIENAIRLYPEGPDYQSLRDLIEKNQEGISSGSIVVG